LSEIDDRITKLTQQLNNDSQNAALISERNQLIARRRLEFNKIQ
jgi:Tfp pilus assembly protein PilO